MGRKFNIECSECGAEYEVLELKSYSRDKDCLRCEKCGNVLRSWNGGIYYVFAHWLKNPAD